MWLSVVKHVPLLVDEFTSSLAQGFDLSLLLFIVGSQSRQGIHFTYCRNTQLTESTKSASQNYPVLFGSATCQNLHASFLTVQNVIL